jgi:hypothetical protein
MVFVHKGQMTALSTWNHSWDSGMARTLATKVKFPMAVQNEFASNSPGSTVVVVRGLGHYAVISRCRE